MENNKKNNRVLKVFLPLGIVILVIMALMLMSSLRPKVVPTPPKPSAHLVSVMDVNIGSISPTLPLYGFVESPRKSKMASAVGGDVAEVLASEGDLVEDGQVLVRLDKFDLELNLRDRQADMIDIEAQIRSENIKYESDKESLLHEQSLLKLSRDKLKRAEKLFKRKVGSESALEDARRIVEQQSLSITAKKFTVDNHSNKKSQLDAHKIRTNAVLKRAQRDLDRAEIKAPFSGRIASVNVSQGDRIVPGHSIVSIYDTSTLEVRSQIPSSYITKIRTLLDRGDQIFADGEIDGVKINLRLDRLSGEAERGNAGIAGLFKVTAGEGALVLGRFINIQLTLPAEQGVFTIPFEGLHGSDKVYLMKDGKMKLARVTRIGDVLGEGGETRVLLRSSEIKDGDKIIVTHIPYAITGLAVKIAGSSKVTPATTSNK